MLLLTGWQRATNDVILLTPSEDQSTQLSQVKRKTVNYFRLIGAKYLRQGPTYLCKLFEGMLGIWVWVCYYLHAMA